MANEIPLPMPKMSMTMETGEMISWSVAAGDTVKSGDVLAEVQTDKVDMEVESPVDGVIARLVAQPGDVVDVGAPIAFILSESDDLMAGLFDPPPDGASEPATPGSDVAPAGPDRNGSARGTQGRDPGLPQGTAARGPEGPPAGRRTQRLARGRAGHRSRRCDHRRGRRTRRRRYQWCGRSPAAPARGRRTRCPGARAGRRPAGHRRRPGALPAAAPAAAADDPGFADALAPRRKAIRSAIARTMTPAPRSRSSPCSPNWTWKRRAGSGAGSAGPRC